MQGLVKFSDDKEVYASSLQGLALVLNTIWTLIYLCFKEYWNHLFGLTTVQMLAMLLMIWSTGTFRFWAATQRNEFKYRKLVILTLIVSLLKPLLGIFLVIYSEDKVTARILSLAIVEFLGYSWLFFVQMSRGRTFYSAKYWKHALWFNIPLIPHYLSQAVLNSSDRIMIRNMVGLSEAGIYGLAYSVSRLLGMLNTALVQTYSPWAYQKIKAGRAEEIGNIGIAMMVGVAGVNLILIALAPEIVAVFAPKPYHDAIWIVPPVAMSVLFTFLYNLFSVVEFYFEKTKLVMLASLFGAVLNIILNFFFIQMYGYIAAGYTTLFCYIVYCFLHFLLMKSVSRKYLSNVEVYKAKVVLLVSLTFMGIGFIFLALYTNTPLRYLFLLLLLVVGFLNRKIIIDRITRILAIRNKRGLK